MKNPDWRAIQAPKDASSKEVIPQTNCKPRYMAMGSFRADAHKGGVRREHSQGSRTKTRKSVLRIGPYKKEKIFSPVLIRI